MKIQLYSKSAVDEVRAACRVNDMVNGCPYFTRTYGWLRCLWLPDEWYQKLSSKVSSMAFMNREGVGANSLIYTVSEVATYAINDPSVRSLFSLERHLGVY